MFNIINIFNEAISEFGFDSLLSLNKEKDAKEIIMKGAVPALGINSCAEITATDKVFCFLGIGGIEMARKQRFIQAGFCYHVMLRGNSGLDIFKDATLPEKFNQVEG